MAVRWQGSSPAIALQCDNGPKRLGPFFAFAGAVLYRTPLRHLLQTTRDAA